MRFKEIYIESYKGLVNFRYKFLEKNEFYPQIFNELNLQIIIGENGAGKTSFLEFIGNVFSNLIREEYYKKIQSNFKFVYYLEGINEEITLEKEENIILLKVNNSIIYYNEGCKEKTKRRSIFDNLKKYLPYSVIISNFSIDDDYPKKRSIRFIGYNPIVVNTVGSERMTRGFYLNISKGFFIFYKEYYNNKDYRDFFYDSIGIELKEIVEGYYSTIQIEDELNDFYNKNLEEINKELLIENFDEFLVQVETAELFRKKGLINKFDTDFNLKLILESKKIIIKLFEFLIDNRVIYINNFFIVKKGKIMDFTMMSSGEKTLFYRVLSTLSDIEDNSIVIFDELEIHLNIIWTKQLIDIIKTIFKKYKSQIFISTHQYLFINSVFKENIIFLKNGIIKEINNTLFLANEDAIIGSLYPTLNSYTAGEKFVFEKIRDSEYPLEKLYDILGESYLKYLVFIEIERRKNVESKK